MPKSIRYCKQVLKKDLEWLEMLEGMKKKRMQVRKRMLRFLAINDVVKSGYHMYDVEIIGCARQAFLQRKMYRFFNTSTMGD